MKAVVGLVLATASVAAVAAAIFAPTAGFGLVSLDDVDYLLGNPLLQKGLTGSAVAEAFRGPVQAMYAPLLWISYMLDIEVWHATRAQPWGFHLTNVLLHALNAGMFFLLLRKWTGKVWVAAVCADLWALHPMRVESVAWIAERKDVLSGAFFLGTLWAYGEAFGGTGGRWRKAGLWTAALVSAGLGMLSKASLTPLPGVLLLLDFWPLRRCRPEWGEIRRKGWRLVAEKLPFAAMAVFCSRMAVAAHGSALGLGEVASPGRLAAVPVHCGFYITKTLWPAGLHPLYPVQEAGWVGAAVWTGVFAAATWLAWRVRRKAPEVSVGWLWFLGVLLPASGLVQFGAQDVADRFSYLPSMGLALMLLPVAAWALGQPGRKGAVGAGCVAALLAGCAAATVAQERHWRDEEALMARLERFMPRHYAVLQHRGAEMLKERGDFAGAFRLFGEALRESPMNEGSFINASICLCETVSPDAARAYLERRPELEGILVEYGWKMGVYCYLGGRYREALAWAERICARQGRMTGGETPESELAMVAAYRMGDAAKALALARGFRRWQGLEEVGLAELFPFHAMLWEDCLRREAAAYFLELEAACPDRVDLLNNMAWLMATSKWSPLGTEVPLRMAERACALGGEHPVLLDTLGTAQANAGYFTAAEESALRAIRLSEEAGTTQEFKRRMEERLQGYRRGEAYREEAGLRML